MHKGELAAKIARKTDLDERAAATLVNMFLSEITASLKRGQKVTLTGFGTFEIRRAKKRVSHDIKTDSSIIIPAHKRVGFIAGLPLKRSVR